MKDFSLRLLLVLLLINTTVKAQPLFTRILSDQSGINFNNFIQENKDINDFTYGYLYNGGGVCVGDINNDGLPDLYFSGNMVQNKLYLNLGNFKFKDITDSAGVSGGFGYKTGVTMVDINGDGFIDIYVCKSALRDPDSRRNMLFINNGNLTFTDKAKEYGLDDPSYSSQAYFYDMDLDGDLDMLLLNHPPDMNYANKIELGYNKTGQLVAQNDTQRTYVSYRYYENVNGHFRDKTVEAGLGTYAYGLSAIIDDFNNDGFPDIYTCNDYNDPDYLFINDKHGKFVNKLDDYFKHGSFSSMGSDYADINNDGLLDLLVMDMIPETLPRQKQLKGVVNYDNFYKRVQYGFGYQYDKNVLQLNNGNHTYSDISYLSGVAFTDWSWAPLIADFDNDGFKDIYITNGYLRDVTDMDFMVYRADSIVKALYKADNPKDAMKLLSTIPSNKILNSYYRNNGDLTFEKRSIESGLEVPSWSNGAVYADLDNDGDLDLIVNNVNDEPFVYKNNCCENKKGNFIRFKLKGVGNNSEGIGTGIEIQTPDGKKQVQHFMPGKGYLSSNERFVHFGIGSNENADVRVTWPNGKTQSFKAMKGGEVHILEMSNADSKIETTQMIPTTFVDVTKQTHVSFKPKENTFNDFKLEPLLPHQFSKSGPCISVADVNGDHLEDFFVGGSKDNEGVIYIQDSSGKFSLTKQPAITLDKKFEDTGAFFFDADQDGDQDLLVVSGGNEYPENETMYPVRLYLNDGKGNFSRSTAFQNVYTSGKAIAIEDFDKDGDADVFIGGRVVPGHYGLIPKSYLFQNRKGQFTDITSQIPALQNIGMVTDAIWCDVDADGWKDLVLVGEWMPLTILKNKAGKLDSVPVTFENTYGWWNTIEQVDIDGDGDMDLVGGNVGTNTRYKSNPQFPLTMLVSDFDNNGSTDCIISMFQDGKSYPLALRDNLLDQMNFLKKKFLRYKDYANASINDIFTPEQISKARAFKANNLQSVLFVNDGKGNYSQQSLPLRAQIAPVNSIIAEDVDKDGKMDLLLTGNDYSSEVETGRNDAGIGLFLKNEGTGKFTPMPVTKSGFYVPGDVKCMKRIKVHNKSCFIIGKNEGEIQFLGYR